MLLRTRKDFFFMKKKISRYLRLVSQRYGTDELYFFLFGITVCILLLNLALDSFFIPVIAIALFTYTVYRALSLDFKRRKKENEGYLRIVGKIKAPVLRQINTYKLKDTYTISKCKKCSAVIYAPKENKVTRVTCSRCGTENTVRAKKK